MVAYMQKTPAIERPQPNNPFPTDLDVDVDACFLPKNPKFEYSVRLYTYPPNMMQYSIRFNPIAKSVVTYLATKFPRGSTGYLIRVPNPREWGQTWGEPGSIDCEQRLPGTGHDMIRRELFRAFRALILPLRSAFKNDFYIFFILCRQGIAMGLSIVSK